jgi:hypothetical protein
MLLAATDHVRPDSLADAVTALAENENARPWREARLRAAAQRLARRAAGPGGDFSMIVSGRTVVPVAVPELWAALSDPARLGQALPHVDTVDVRDDGSFSAIARPRTGLGDTPLRMEFEIADRREGEHVRIVGSGLAGENTVSLNTSSSISRLRTEVPPPRRSGPPTSASAAYSPHSSSARCRHC